MCSMDPKSLTWADREATEEWYTHVNLKFHLDMLKQPALMRI